MLQLWRMLVIVWKRLVNVTRSGLHRRLNAREAFPNLSRKETTHVQFMASKYAAAFQSPSGAGDARPTALNVIEDEGLCGSWGGKVALVTGCSSGIGVETARALHATGAQVYATVRDLGRGKAVVADIQANSTGHGKTELPEPQLLQLELDSLESVRQCAEDFLKDSKQLNVLILNAGVMACPEGKTKNGFETQFGINHLAHFLLFQLLKPALLASSTPSFKSRVVSVASSGHRISPVLFDDLDLSKRGYDMWVAYGQSKTANIYLANEIDRRYGSKGLHATSIHPGWIWHTRLARHLDEETANHFNTPEARKQHKSPAQGAATTVWAAVAKEWEGRGGKYLEDCSESQVVEPGETVGVDGGCAKHAYDVIAAAKVWVVSLKLLGLDDSD